MSEDEGWGDDLSDLELSDNDEASPEVLSTSPLSPGLSLAPGPDPPAKSCRSLTGDTFATASSTQQPTHSPPPASQDNNEDNNEDDYDDDYDDDEGWSSDGLSSNLNSPSPPPHAKQQPTVIARSSSGSHDEGHVAALQSELDSLRSNALRSDEWMAQAQATISEMEEENDALRKGLEDAINKPPAPGPSTHNEEEISRFLEESSAVKEENSALRRALEAAMDEVGSAKALSEELERLRSSCKAIEKERDCLNLALKEASGEIDAAKGERDGLLKSSSDKCRMLEEQVKVLKSENAELKSAPPLPPGGNFAALESTVQSLTSKCESLSSAVEDLESTNASLRQASESSNDFASKCASLEKEVEALSEALRSEREYSAKECASLSSEVEALNSVNEVLKRDMKGKDEEASLVLNGVEEEKAVLSGMVEELRAALKEAEEGVKVKSDLEAENASLSGAIRSLEEAAKEREKRINDLERSAGQGSRVAEFDAELLRIAGEEKGLRSQLRESEVKRGEILVMLADERERNAENLRRMGEKVRALLRADSNGTA